MTRQKSINPASELLIKGEIRRLHLEPRDVLIVKLTSRLAPQEFEEATAHIRRALEGVGITNKFLVTTPDADFEVAGE